MNLKLGRRVHMEIMELERLIAEKNTELDLLRKDRKRNRKIIEEVQKELDSLLYKYYKSLICKTNRKLSFCVGMI